jgi:RNA polymerase sigma-70 factor (ECF subfamily)
LVTDAPQETSVQAWDADAFTSIYRAHFASLCGVARRYVRTREAAEELVQDVLLRVWEQRSDWAVRESVQAYLHAAVRNHALDALKRQAVARRWQARVVRDGEAGIGRRPATADDAVVARELAQAVARLVAALPPRCREAYVLRREQFLSLDEIARVMGIAPKTVEIQIGLALRALRRGLADWLPGSVPAVSRSVAS